MAIEYNVIYPEKGWVSEATIRMWYKDSIDNKELPFTIAPIPPAFCGDPIKLKFIMNELMSLGVVTFTTKTRVAGEPGISLSGICP